MTRNIIPPMTHPFSKGWKQPSTDAILVDDTHALMNKTTYDALLQYNTSVPSGVYEGKMWSCCCQGRHYLRWYDVSDDPSKCSIQTREVIFL